MMAVCRPRCVWRTLWKNKLGLFAVTLGLYKAQEAHLQVLKFFILLLETWEKLECQLQNIPHGSNDKM